MIGAPTTTLTVYRRPGSSSPGLDGMVDPWDEDEQAAVAWTPVSFNVPARIASPAPTGLMEPSARQENTPLAVVDPGTDIRLGDEVVDDSTTARYRITSATERTGLSPQLAHRRLGLVRVTMAAADTVGI